MMPPANTSAAAKCAESAARAAPLDSRARWVCHSPAAAADPRPAPSSQPGPARLPLNSGHRAYQLSLHTPVGDITVSEDDAHIVALDWGWGRDQTETPLLARARAQLDAYFDGEAVTFDLPLAPAGTAYQRRVWAALRRIPPGATRTYGDIAAEAGGSARSVGGANGCNPIPIIIPCHRVVAAAGLGGYSGGDGLATKRTLLDLEARALDLLSLRTVSRPTPGTGE